MTEAAFQPYRPIDRLAHGDDHSARAIVLVRKGTEAAALAGLSDAQRAFVKAAGFEAIAGRGLVLAGPDGAIDKVVFGMGDSGDGAAAPLELGGLVATLPAGDYRIDPASTGIALGKLSREASLGLHALAFLIGGYRFDRYRPSKTDASGKLARLVPPDGIDLLRVVTLAEAVCSGRDLINTPAADMGPAEIEATARELAGRHGAEIRSVIGDDLISENLPMIHAVGRASPRPPRLVDLTWGDKAAPRITLIGKGIAFDTGGLNIKVGEGMLLMKKDMGGAASALALATMIMRRNLRVRLRVLLPIAENSIAGNAFRPGDVLRSRSGTTVEIGNTDAEGRLVVADALTLAGEEKPDHVVTFATLTGAARVALGPDLPPLYCDDDDFSGAVVAKGMMVDDPVWRMPFWKPYDKMIKGAVGEITNSPGSPFAGSLTAAMFLRRFAGDAKCYTHLDIYGWVPKPKPGKPEGGEPQAARAIFEVLEERYPPAPAVA